MSDLGHLPLMLTVEEAAQLLRIGRNGALPSVRIGRTIRIPRAAVADLLGIQRDRDDLPAEARITGETRR
jgi:excisionase family DNA binding protein